VARIAAEVTRGTGEQDKNAGVLTAGGDEALRVAQQTTAAVQKQLQEVAALHEAVTRDTDALRELSALAASQQASSAQLSTQAREHKQLIDALTPSAQVSNGASAAEPA
jgi:hypothetical protein